MVTKGECCRRRGETGSWRRIPGSRGDLVGVKASSATDRGGSSRIPFSRSHAIAGFFGVEDRLHVTGKLSDPELATWLAATNLAVCPFARTAASGSLSTWLASGRPVLISDLPQADELNRLVPGAIETFAPDTATALGEHIMRIVTDPEREGAVTPRVSELARRSSISSVFDRHLAVYRSCCCRSAPYSRTPRPISA